MAVLNEVDYKRPPELDQIYAGTSIQEVDGIPDSEYKSLSPSETVVPRTTLSGGIKGSTKVYPEVTYRKFQGNTQLEERVIKDAKNIGKEKEDLPEPVEDKEIQEVQEMIEQARTQATVQQSEDGQAAMAAMMQSFLAQITKLNLQPAPEKPVEKAAEMTTVRFKGAFGVIDAPYKQVIKGSKCLALVPPEEGSVHYEPPVSTEAILDITVNGMMYSVVNAGISFNMPEVGKVVVLLLAPDLQAGE